MEFLEDAAHCPLDTLVGGHQYLRRGQVVDPIVNGLKAHVDGPYLIRHGRDLLGKGLLHCQHCLVNRLFQLRHGTFPARLLICAELRW